MSATPKEVQQEAMKNFIKRRELFFRYWACVVIFLSPVFIVLNLHLIRDGVPTFYIIVENLIALGITPVTSWVSLDILERVMRSRNNGKL
jgi:hypothetical protein